MANEAPAPVFVLSLPRCRTAWLSVCLSAFGCDTTHEGLRAFPSFAAWAADLDERLSSNSIGPAASCSHGTLLPCGGSRGREATGTHGALGTAADCRGAGAIPIRGAGDANPGLVHWIDALLARWPRARFV